MRNAISLPTSLHLFWPTMVIAALCTACVKTSGEASRAHTEIEPWTKWTGEQVQQVVSPVRAGRRLTPKSWPDGNKVAVVISWDMDNETPMLAAGLTDPVDLGRGEYGGESGFPRILEMHDRLNVPATFFIPQMTGVLYPQLITELKKRPQYEVGLHGRIHENLVKINNRAAEKQLLGEEVEFWTRALGRKPVGFRAPAPGGDSVYTLGLLREAGFEYDTSFSAMDEPYEPLSYGKPTGLVELPVDWVVDDWLMLDLAENSAVDSPEAIYKVYQRDFDRTYKEGTVFMLTAHPMSSGHRSRIQYLEDFILYMKSKPGVWFATARQVAEYVKQQNGMAP